MQVINTTVTRNVRSAIMASSAISALVSSKRLFSALLSDIEAFSFLKEREHSHNLPEALNAVGALIRDIKSFI